MSFSVHNCWLCRLFHANRNQVKQDYTIMLVLVVESLSLFGRKLYLEDVYMNKFALCTLVIIDVSRFHFFT